MKPLTWIELNKANLEHNVNLYRQWLPEQTSIAAVIKGNAYGHGLIEIAKLHEQNPNVTRLCVVNTQEALQLKAAGITKTIFVMSYINSDLSQLVHQNIELAVYDLHTIQELNNIAIAHKTTFNVHLKVDTGLSRLGISPADTKFFIATITKLPGLKLHAIWSHLSSGNNQQTTLEQEDTLISCNSNNIDTHLTNSLGSMLSLNKAHTFARIGLGLYGYHLDKKIPLKPVLSLKSTIIHIRDVAKGCSIGYLQAYSVKQNMRIAIVSIGYNDGINPNLAGNGFIIIHGQLAPIISINMNLTTIDISNIKQCKTGDTATLLGQDGNELITAYDWQKILKTNIRETFCKLNSNLRRLIF